MIGSEGVIELVNENPREEDARITFHGRDGTKELFSFRQGDTYRTQMLEWAGIVRDSVRDREPHPEAPTFTDGLASAVVIDRVTRTAIGQRDDRPGEPT